MNDEDNDTATVDAARTAQLGEWAVAVCVDSNGVEWFWLLSPDGGEDIGCACRTCAPHDQLSNGR